MTTALICCAPSGSLAQDIETAIATGVDAVPVSPTTGETFVGAATVPALTEVAIEILADLGSRTSKQGDTFPLRLAAPVIIDGVELVPAGTLGMGEVIHAKKSGGSGAAGELVLAARYLEFGGRQLPLRSLRVDPTVRDRIGTVNTINVASAAFVPAISFIGFLIKGDQLSIPAGSVLAAKTAMDFTVEAPPVADAPPAEMLPSATPPLDTTAQAVETISATGGETQ